MCHPHSVRLPHEQLHGAASRAEQSRITISHRLLGRALNDQVPLIMDSMQQMHQDGHTVGRWAPKGSKRAPPGHLDPSAPNVMRYFWCVPDAGSVVLRSVYSQPRSGPASLSRDQACPWNKLGYTARRSNGSTYVCLLAMYTHSNASAAYIFVCCTCHSGGHQGRCNPAVLVRVSKVCEFFVFYGTY